MQAVGPPAAGHDTAGVLIDDHHLALLHDVLDVTFIQRVGAQELADRVDVLADGFESLLGLEPALLLFLGREVVVFLQVTELGGEVRHHERIGVFRMELGAPDLGEVGLVLALIDDVVEFLLEVEEFVLVEVGVYLRLDLVEQLAPFGRLHEPEELLVLGMAHLDLQHAPEGELPVVRGEVLFFEKLPGLGDEPVAEARLVVDELVDGGLDARERLLALDGGGAGNDERRAGLVDEDRVDLVDDAVVMVALHLVLLARGHAVVAQVVEAELRSGAVGDVAVVHLAPEVVGHELLDAADGNAEKIVDVAHPLGVAAGEVVVGGDELRVAAGESVEVERKRGDEGLALAGGHFGDLAFVERDAADELHVVVHHVPREFVLAHGDLAAVEAAGGVFDDGKGLGQKLVEGFAGLEAVAELAGLRPELVIGKRLAGALPLVDADDDGPAPLKEFAVVTAGELLQEPGNHEKRVKLNRHGEAWQTANASPLPAYNRQAVSGGSPFTRARGNRRWCASGLPQARWPASTSGRAGPG